MIKVIQFNERILIFHEINGAAVSREILEFIAGRTNQVIHKSQNKCNTFREK